MKKRILSIVLTLAMVLALFPAAIFANEEAGKEDASKAFADALAQDEKDIVINLEADVTYDVAAWQNNAMGGASTETITINGNGKKITFNQTNSDWNNVVTEGAKLIINNAIVTNSGNDATSGTWNGHDIVFNCDVECNDVTFLNAVAVEKNAEFNNVKITDDSTGDAYMLWIRPMGQKVVLDNCVIDATGTTGNDRGIKIDNQYLDADEELGVTLEVSNTIFKTEKKAAILVKTAEGADITVNNVTIDEVAADQQFAVWVDSAAKDSYSLVNFNSSDAFMKIEEQGKLEAAFNGKCYETLEDALAAAEKLAPAPKGHHYEPVELKDAAVQYKVLLLKDEEKVETEVPEIKIEGTDVEIKEPVVVVEPTVGEVKAEDTAAAEALADAVANIEVEADKIAVEQVSNITAEEVTDLVAQLPVGTDTTNVTVETKISLKVENAVLASTENNVTTLTVNITPMVTTKVSADGKSVEKTEKAEVTVPVTVTIPLPDGYFQAGQKLTVVHTKDNGEKYTHVVTVQEKNGALVVEFLNENGFSLFSFAPAYAVIDPIANANVADLPAVIAAYYDEIYEVAYYYADAAGYVDVAVDGLEIAWDALETAKKYVEENVPAELLGVKNEMIGELINTQNTLIKVIDLLDNDKVADVDSLIAEVLGLEEELWAHLDTLKDLAYELGLEIDPYIIKLNDAVVAYGELVDATIVEAYNTLVETIRPYDHTSADTVLFCGCDSKFLARSFFH